MRLNTIFTGKTRLACGSIGFTSVLGLVFLAALATTGCEVTSTISPDESLGVVLLNVVAGDGQTGVGGSELPNPLVVELTSTRGNKVKPITGAVVNFVPTEGGGHMYAGTAVTDENGLAADYWTLGAAAGVNALEVRAVTGAGEKVVYGSFSATAVVPTPEICDGVDNDFNGQIDDGLPYCFSGVVAPNTDGERCLDGWYDLDGDASNGCEGLADPYESNDSWPEAADLGTLSVGNAIVIVANIVPATDSDWFELVLDEGGADYCDAGPGPALSLDWVQNPFNFAMEAWLNGPPGVGTLIGSGSGGNWTLHLPGTCGVADAWHLWLGFESTQPVAGDYEYRVAFGL